MPRYYFHLRTPDESFPDVVGAEICDLTTAHAKALDLAVGVMSYGAFAKLEPSLQRWTVQVVDDCKQPAITVIFPNHVDADKRTCGRPAGGARAVQEYLKEQLFYRHEIDRR